MTKRIGLEVRLSEMVQTVEKSCITHMPTISDRVQRSSWNLRRLLMDLRRVVCGCRALSFAYIVLTQGTKAKSSREGALLNLFIYHEVKW
ncbi:hypothetical protein SAMN04488518_1133 [Pseudovibrio ascidiaceicola]|uniref:Uncharacterized protein n=1 Tax=Pseudovibrio ascidiaceicola TaxID=285279 RepID=A0A1I4DV51_9HYPH|nr:hypothetical protein SAMN04488518_1133 [Pseudovibrio ascidiaceicola]